jgi:thymidylate synthase
VTKDAPSEWPLYFRDRLIIENIESSVGVITLWMPKENVAENLKDNTYSVCGQLYTKQGISYILRNILAYPKIQHLVMLGVDRQESGEALKCFFKNGVEPKEDSDGDISSWKIIGTEKAFIDKEIPKEFIEKIRVNVKLYDMQKSPLKDVAEKIEELHDESIDNKLFCEPQVFAEPEKVSPETYPSDASVFKIRREYIGDAWLDALKVVTRFGRRIPGMYGEVGQVANLSIVIEEEDPSEPKLYDFFNFDKKQLELYYKGFFDKNEEKKESYTYGERIFNWDSVDQEDIMVKKLKRFEYDRGALAVLWKPHVDNFPPERTERREMGQTKKWRVPCLVMILGQVVEGKFNMTAIFRNNDIYGAWPLNAFALRDFQKRLAKKIDKKLGSLTTISHIAEIYELNWQESLRIVEENDHLGRTCQYDPRGYYTVCLGGEDKEEIKVTFFSPDGTDQLAEYSINGMQAKAARDLSAMILKDMLVSDLGAACDLGRQLAKAENAVKLNLEFQQDHPLSFS